MTLFESLDKNLPAELSRSGEVFTSLFGTPDAHQLPVIQTSGDYNSGAFINELLYLRDYLKRLYSGELSDKTGDLLDSIGSFFTGTGRFVAEPDADYLSRILAILQRKAKVWSTQESILGGLSQVIDPSLLFYQSVPVWVDPVSNPNLFANADFENGLLGWTLTGGASIVTGSAFSGTASLVLSSSGDKASQSVALTSAIYRVSFFSTGTPLTFFLQNPGGQYWNPTALAWQTGFSGWSFASSGNWNPTGADFQIATAGNYTVGFQGSSSGQTRVDLCELAFSPTYPGFKVYLLAANQQTSTTLTVTDGATDSPSAGYLAQGSRFIGPDDAESLSHRPQWPSYSYIGGEVGGPLNLEYLSSLMQILRPTGVRGEIVTVTRS